MLKEDNTFLELSESSSLQQTLRDLNTAFKRYFNPKNQPIPDLKAKRTKKKVSEYKTTITM